MLPWARNSEEMEKLSAKFLVEGDVRLGGFNPKSLSVMT